MPEETPLSPHVAVPEGLPEETLLENLKRAIETCQHIMNDSRTPLNDAIPLMTHIRTLVESRRALRAKAFRAAAAEPQYQAATAALKTINDTIKAEVMAHSRTLTFVRDAATAAAAVLDLATAVGALVI